MPIPGITAPVPQVAEAARPPGYERAVVELLPNPAQARPTVQRSAPAPLRDEDIPASGDRARRPPGDAGAAENADGGADDGAAAGLLSFAGGPGGSGGFLAQLLGQEQAGGGVEGARIAADFSQFVSSAYEAAVGLARRVGPDLPDMASGFPVLDSGHALDLTI